MGKYDWKMLKFPKDREFKFRHALAWLLYVWLVKWNLEALWEARQSDAMYLIPAIVLSWASILTAGASIENWLDGANRYLLFRIALVSSALLSIVLALWMTWHYATFLLVGTITLFRRPFELISMVVFVERFGIVGLGVLTFAMYAWLSLRVALVLLSGEKQANLDQVLGEESFGDLPMVQPPLRADELPVVQKNPQYVNLGITIQPRLNRYVPSAEEQFKRAFVGPPRPPDEPGKQRFLRRPESLQPAFHYIHGGYKQYDTPVLKGLAWRDSIRKDKLEQSRDLGWAAFEWVLRTQPSLEEVYYALMALPNLAGSVDEDDALELRDWISRLADHPGMVELPTPGWRDAMDGPKTYDVRIADAAMQVLMDWDGERQRLRHDGGAAPDSRVALPA